ncbi:SRPBCC family protein [uncultured Nevskia sp.]|uniref:SRPBCC family protein n=1 Tax=uncultured Nevskia sp. TaxID=228950 RepID=UPI0025F17115|nr:SRPBCC family protein [uncultured Nevskia sp.]
MQTIEIVQEFSRPVAEVYEELADHNRLGKVLGVPVVRVRDGNSSVNGVGSVRRIGVAPLAIEETVVGAVAGKSIDYKITRGGWPLKNHHGRLVFKPLTGGRSQLTWHIEFNGALPGSAFLVKQILNLAISRGLKKIA